MGPCMMSEVNINRLRKEYGFKKYLLDRRIVNLPRVSFGGVGAGDGLGAGSLILTPDVFLFMTFRGFFRGGGVTTILHLLAQVREDPALGPADESSAD
jgi:hypothetical protein